MTEGNALYYGDNLEIMRRYLADESVDLVYLDPPFNSNATYNVIFRDESGQRSDAQIEAFDDTWHWGPSAEEHYRFLTNTAYHEGRVSSTLSAMIGAFHAGIRPSPMLAYLVEMAVRLVELHRVLKPSGSLYLHCDPTASHYLKLLLDATFGPTSFANEIIWKRKSGHSDARRFGRVHDVVLYYTKTPAATWNDTVQAYDQAYVDAYYRYSDPDGRRFMSGDLSASGLSGGGYEYEWKGITRTWRVPRATMERLEAENRIFYTRNRMPRIKRYLDESRGMPTQDIWADIEPLRSWHKERLEWPTQKPVALLERIIEASSNPGDLVLDPFCGCGTALVAAQKLGRRWIGIDITYLSIAVMRDRLRSAFPELGEIEVVGRPTEVEGARQLLAKAGFAGQYQFQWWALDLVGAAPKGGMPKAGADRGVDGLITFSGPGSKVETCIVSVKSGKVTRSMIAQLKGDMQAADAVMGLFITLEEPTEPMRQEAADAGFYHSEVSGRDYPAVQIITIRELLEEGRRPQLPLLVLPAYQRAQREGVAPDQPNLFG